MSKKKTGGHPANKSPMDLRVYKAMVTTMELTRDLQGKVSEERFDNLRVASLGLMFVYSELTGMPKPDINLDMDFDEFMADKAAARNNTP